MSIENLGLIFDTLEAGKVRYLVVGGFAVMAHGHMRLTHDLDLVIALDEQNTTSAIAGLKAIGYKPALPIDAGAFIDPKLRAKMTAEKNMVVFQMIADDPTRPAIDLFVTEPFDFETEYAGAPRIELVEGRKTPVVSLETLLAMKRRSGRHIDLADIEDLERISPKRESPGAEA